jgi:hypothetical protein
VEDIHRRDRNEQEVKSSSKNEKADMQDSEKKNLKKQDKKDSKPKPTKKRSFLALVNWKWVITAFLSSLVISILLSVLSSEVLSAVSIVIALLILLAFIMLGIVFDIIGLSVATANEKPFNSMAAQRINAGKTGLALIRKADQVSSFCNDVIGDICGVVSGSAAATIAIKISSTMGIDGIFISLILCGLVSAITVGGKAIGKALGMNYSVEIVTLVAKLLSIFTRNSKKGKARKSAKDRSNKKFSKNEADSDIQNLK